MCQLTNSSNTKDIPEGRKRDAAPTQTSYSSKSKADDRRKQMNSKVMNKNN